MIGVVCALALADDGDGEGRLTAVPPLLRLRCCSCGVLNVLISRFLALDLPTSIARHFPENVTLKLAGTANSSSPDDRKEGAGRAVTCTMLGDWRASNPVWCVMKFCTERRFNVEQSRYSKKLWGLTFTYRASLPFFPKRKLKLKLTMKMRD